MVSLDPENSLADVQEVGNVTYSKAKPFQVFFWEHINIMSNTLAQKCL